MGVRFGREVDVPVLFVRDNGMGIDSRYYEKVFCLFERLDAADEGTGIGLALVEGIVAMHGGSIWVESDGAGLESTFCFTLADARQQDRREGGESGGVVEASDRFGVSSVTA